MESAACGLAAGINAYRFNKGEETLIFPEETAIGSLIRYISVPAGNFQPMNINFGIMPPLNYRERKKGLKMPQSLKGLWRLWIFLWRIMA